MVKLSIAARVGGAAGGVVMIVILCIIGYRYQRHRRSANSYGTEKQDGPDIITIQPNLIPFTGYQGAYTVAQNQPNPGYVEYRFADPTMEASIATEQGEVV